MCVCTNASEACAQNGEFQLSVVLSLTTEDPPSHGHSPSQIHLRQMGQSFLQAREDLREPQTHWFSSRPDEETGSEN